jgi:Fe-S-cluster-containing hydrogenase component 2
MTSESTAGSRPQHPAVKRALEARRAAKPPAILDADWLRQVCLECGADDVGFVSLSRAEIDDQRAELLRVFPPTKALISFVCRMNREPVRSVARSKANNEFKQIHHSVDHVSHEIARRLEDISVRAMNEPMAFPMEVAGFPDKIWTISHKPIAVAAGLGQMGIHRNVIHPKFGNFVLLGTVLVDLPIGLEMQPIDYNPCFECKLCVAACPVGAIGADGHFDFSACTNHNYREFMGGFNDWVDTVAESKNSSAYRERYTPGETASVWQSLSMGAQYKSAYCMAVCPAGDDVIGLYLDDKAGHVQGVLRPLQDKQETLYVVQGSDADQYARKRFPHKRIKTIKGGLTPQTIRGFVEFSPHFFQRNNAKGVEATFHFRFRGQETGEATFEIANQTLTVKTGLHGTPSIVVTADSSAFLKVIAGRLNPVLAVMRGQLKLRGPRDLMNVFQKCFAI